MFFPISVVEIGISVTILPTEALRCREIVTCPAVCRKVTDSSPCLHSCLFSVGWWLYFLSQMPDYTLSVAYSGKWSDERVEFQQLELSWIIQKWRVTVSRTIRHCVVYPYSLPSLDTEASSTNIDRWWPQCPVLGHTVQGADPMPSGCWRRQSGGWGRGYEWQSSLWEGSFTLGLSILKERFQISTAPE